MIDLENLGRIGVGIRPSINELIGPGSTVREIIEASLEQGLNLIDLAKNLGLARVEKELCKILRELDCRDKLFIITKGGIKRDEQGLLRPDGRPENIRTGVNESLELLGLDVLDCYQIYWPDDNVPLSETIGVLDELREQGKIRYTGVTNFTPEQIEAAEEGGKIDFVQFPYSLFQLQAESDLLPYCRDKNLRRVAYGVLCRGLLTDDFLEAGELEYDTLGSNLAHVRDNFSIYRHTVHQIAKYFEEENGGGPLASSMISWVLAQPNIDHAITVAHNKKQVEVIARAREISLSQDQITEISSIVREIVGGNVDRDFVIPPHASD